MGDMVSEMHKLNQETFTYPCRPAAGRLGVDKETVCSALKRLCVLGITKQVQRGQVKGLSGEGYAERQQVPISGRDTAPGHGGCCVYKINLPSTNPKPNPRRRDRSASSR